MAGRANPLASPFWRGWLLWCRIRYSYFLFLVLVFVIVFAMSTMMEVFFLMFMPSSKSAEGYQVTFSYLVPAFPIALLIFSWLFDEVADLFMDCISESGGGMPTFRAAQVTFLHALRNFRHFYGCGCCGYGGSGNGGGAGKHTSVNSAKPVAYGTVPGTEPEDDNGLPPLADIPLVVGEYMSEEDKSLVAQAARHPYTGPPVAPSTYAAVDLVQPYLFDALVVASLITGTAIGGSMSTGLIAVVQGGFLVAFSYSVMWTVIDLIVSAKGETRRLFRHIKARQAVINYRVLETRLDEDSNVMGYSLAVTVGNVCGLRRCVEDPSNPTGRRADRRPLLGEWAWIFVSLLLYGVACGIALWNIMVGFYLLMLSMWLLASAVEKKSEGVLGKKFRVFLATFIFLTSALFTFISVVGASAADVDITQYVRSHASTSSGGGGSSDVARRQLEVVQHGGGDGQRTLASSLSAYNPFVSATATEKYTVCAADFSGLTIIDFGLLAQAAYTVENSTDMDFLLQQYFGGVESLGNVTLVKAYDTSFVKFAEVHFSGIDTTVIAVRGTTTAMDALEDMHYWFGIGFLQTLSKIMLPIIDQLPETFVCWMLYLAGLNSLGPAPIYEFLVSTVIERRAALCGDSSTTDGDCRFYITGHSLGGGMAALAGARTGTNAISFSGPGIRYLRYRFGVDEDDIKSYVLTIKPEDDLVPQIDVLDGLTQMIQCTAGNALDCHMIYNTICTLYDSCGDFHDRDWSDAGC